MSEGTPRGPQSNRAVVYRELRRRIVTLELEPGAALSENDIAAQLSVSRTPVRESLILLAEEDLVQVFPKLGSFVSRIDPERVAGAQFVREAVELASMRDAVAGASASDVAELRELLARQVEARTTSDFFELDEQFHHTLMRAGGHANAWRTVVSAKAHLDRARRLGMDNEHSFTELVAEHTAVVDALEQRAAEEAVEALRAHLRRVFTDIGRLREQSPHLFADADARPTRRIVTTWE